MLDRWGLRQKRVLSLGLSSCTARRDLCCALTAADSEEAADSAAILDWRVVEENVYRHEDMSAARKQARAIAWPVL
jgi:hypothetical protein